MIYTHFLPRSSAANIADLLDGRGRSQWRSAGNFEGKIVAGFVEDKLAILKSHAFVIIN